MSWREPKLRMRLNNIYRYDADTFAKELKPPKRSLDACGGSAYFCPLIFWRLVVL